MFELLDLTKWPSMPAPWSSTDSGETWVWGDFFMTFQKKPKTVLDQSLQMQGKKQDKTGLIYHYSMLVFYCSSKNPHGSSPAPIMAICLETDYTDVLEHLGHDVLDEIANEDGIGAWMIGLIAGEARANLGEYEYDSHRESVKKYFFEVLKDQLKLTGEPHKIGLLIDAFGHPETGLESRKIDEAKETKPKPKPKPQSNSNPQPKPRPANSRPAQRPSAPKTVTPSNKGRTVSKVFGVIVLVIAGFIWLNNYEKASDPYKKYSSSSNNTYPTTSQNSYQNIPKQNTSKMYVSAAALNVRAKPNGGSVKVGQLSKYDTITVLNDKKIGIWAAFNFKGNLSYVHSKYIKPGSGSTARIADCRKSGVVRPGSGTIIKASKNGIHSLEVKNGAGPDALVKLKNASGQTVFMAYVHGGATLRANNIPTGSFQFQYATGRNYSLECEIFLDNVQASKDPKFVKYEKTYGSGGYYTTAMQYTLYRVSGGNLQLQSISAEQF